MSKRHAPDEPTGAETPAKRSRIGEATPPTPNPELACDVAAASLAAAPTTKAAPARTTPPKTTTPSSEKSIEDATADLDLDDDTHDHDDNHAHTQPVSIRQSAPTAGYDDLYLDTIDRNVLDFDFEKLCSVSLSNINVYACLVCGRYFQGRGPKSHAYFHALDEDHHVFINLETQRVYVLPEGYEVRSRALDDIKYVADPRYTREEVAALDRPRQGQTEAQQNQHQHQQQQQQHQSWTLSGQPYTPGFVGMNNIKENDYVNVVVQALAHVAPLRNYLLLDDFSSPAVATRYSELVRRCSTLVRKVWNPRAFRAHVSPHELLQEIALRSGKRFTLTRQSDPVDFLSWFLNNLHLGLGGSKSRPGSSMVQRVFQGRLKVESQAITARADEVQDRLRFEESADVKVDVARFMLLTLDLPPPPLFQDELEGNIIPQVGLDAILAKYDGRRAQEHLAQRKRYRLLHPLPPYLILHIKRFSQNKFVAERNPTIVTFDPRAGLNVAPYVDPASASASSSDGAGWTPGEPIMYDLVANIVHEAVRSKDVDGMADSGEERKTWKVQVRDRATDEWVSCQDLYVEKTQPEMLYLGETYVQIWERRRVSKGKGGKAV